MREAYEHAERGDYCQEIDTLNKIDRFGIEAILGRRQFFYGELRKMITAENIVKSYISRKQSQNWADWARDNSVMAGLLLEAEKLCQ